MELRSKRRGLIDPTITQDEWRKALGDASTVDDPSAMTVMEMCDRYGSSRVTVQRRIQELLKSGKAVRTYKRVILQSGMIRRIAAYKLVRPPQKPSKR